MTGDSYFLNPAVNISTLLELRKSPAHYRHAVASRGEDSERAVLRFGTVTHLALFEPERLEERVVVYPGARRQGNEWNAFKTQHEGKSIVKQNEYDDIMGVVNAIRTYPLAASMFAQGQGEVPLYWRCDEFACKSKLDWVTPEGLIVDLKTTKDATPRGFAKSCASYDYHVRAAFYCDAYEHVHKRKPKGFVLVAIEKVEPYALGLYEFDDLGLAYGREEYRRLLALLRECKAKDEWPGPTADEIKTIELPPWAAGSDATVTLYGNDGEVFDV